MPIPVNSNCNARSMKNARLGKLIGVANPRNKEVTWIWKWQLNRADLSVRERTAMRSIVEVDVLVVDDRALFVSHDVVAVQAIAILVEVIFAFRTGEFFGAKDGLADFRRIGRAGLVDRGRQDGDGIVGPRTLVVRRGLVGVAIGLAEALRGVAGVFRIVRHAIGAEQSGARKLGRGNRDHRGRADPGN